MNVGMLSTLVAILDKGSFAEASHEVGCTPSAVSLQVKQLETYLGHPLFDRSARSVKPMPIAWEVAAAAREFLASLDALRARRAAGVSGRVRLGSIATVHTGPLPQALRMLRDRHPSLEVEVFPNDSDALLAELKGGRIDAAVLVRPQSGGSSRLVWHNLARQPYVMLVPPGTSDMAPQDLLGQHEVIRYDTALTGGRIAARYVRQVCPRARYAMDVRAIDAIVAMVSAGLGVSVVPQPRRALLDAYGVREVSLGRSGPTRQIAVVRRSAAADNRNIEAVTNALTRAFRGAGSTPTAGAVPRWV
jgi:DNA-binding transcriptional LysR family regulator